MAEGFAMRLKALRHEKGLSQAEAAALAGVSTNHYGKWELGKAFPRAASLEALAEAFGVTSKWLMIGQGEKTPAAEQAARAEKERTARDEAVTAYPMEKEQELKDIVTLIGCLKQLDIPKARKRHIHRTLCVYRADLESIVLFGEEVHR